MKKFSLLLLFVIMLGGCKKDALDSFECGQLQTAMATDNKTAVKNQIEKAISRLPSKDYNEANLNKLIASLEQCGFTVTMPCYDCIKTNPSQSEFFISFYYQGSSMQKVIDLTYDSAKRIKFQNLHD